MINKKAIIIVIINIIVAVIADYLILSGHWHYGKDGGFFPRMECSIILSPISYCILAKKNKLIFGIIGFIIGYLSIIISMLFINRYTSLDNIFYHILSIFFVFIIFFCLPNTGSILNNK